MTDKLTEDEINKLLKAAQLVREQAYAPYSNFRVGAAVLSDDEEIYTGCNVENVSYGLTICAERAAVFKAVADGRRKFRALAIAAGTDLFCTPCGACRQVMAEFGDYYVIQSDKNGSYVINTVKELLPGSFSSGMLGKEIVK